jgi:hypothetical protein
MSSTRRSWTRSAARLRDGVATWLHPKQSLSRTSRACSPGRPGPTVLWSTSAGWSRASSGWHRRRHRRRGPRPRGPASASDPVLGSNRLHHLTSPSPGRAGGPRVGPAGWWAGLVPGLGAGPPGAVLRARVVGRSHPRELRRCQRPRLRGRGVGRGARVSRRRGGRRRPGRRGGGGLWPRVVARR